MNIKFVELQNFRKLKSCRIDLSNQKTLFVGANNSGKTSAMDALIHFLVKGRRTGLSTTDFTLSNWHEINDLASSWLGSGPAKGTSLSEWQHLCPSLDVWLEVNENEVHYVSHLIPTLSWDGGALGVRLIFQPKNLESLQGDYLSACSAAQETLQQANKKPGEGELTLWPRTMRDFLDEKKLHSHFGVQAFILDPLKVSHPIDGVACPQALIEDPQPLDVEPFEGLFKIDLIEAQRGFTDPNASIGDSSMRTSGNLSAQMHNYYSNHLNPSELPDVDDLEALQAIETARTLFDSRLKESFGPAISEIEGLGYPGFNDPTISLTSKLNPVDSLDHETAIQYNIQGGSEVEGKPTLRLPEKYNGLGYKNLIAMVFKLISFRDGWMRIGKAGKRKLKDESIVEPLHLVLIEEPEAHLHVQVQQVFIRRAYDVLRNHDKLKLNDQFSTQMVVSSHSSSLAHEVDFSNLRYFRRKIAEGIYDVPCATVVNLSHTFGDKVDETAKFVARYLKTTHCDLFFANGVILVEGAAERMLMPHFIRTHYEKLNRSYISILEIGGSHAYRIRSLIDSLGLATLVITDIDAANKDGKKVVPVKGAGYSTNNNTLKEWAPGKAVLDELLEAKPEERTVGNVRVAYQCGVEVKFGKDKSTAFPYTFEDALTFANIDLFKEIKKPTGLVNKMCQALNGNSLKEACEAMNDALKGGDKAKMALDLLFDVEPEKLMPPKYIAEGLAWLEMELDSSTLDYVEGTSKGEGEGDV